MRVPLLLFAIIAALLPAHAEDPAREAKRRFKGVELYSWRDEVTNTWRYSLLSGTNRLKTPMEIMAPEKAVAEVALLKVQLSQLAVGERISWVGVDRAHRTLPPQEIVDDIVRTAAALQLKLSQPAP